MSQNRTRRRFSPEQKSEIVRRHLAGREPVSALAEEFGLQPSQIHNWVNQAMAQVHRAFERSPDQPKTERKQQQRIQQLEDKLAVKNEVIAELMEENVKAKKDCGEL